MFYSHAFNFKVHHIINNNNKKKIYSQQFFFFYSFWIDSMKLVKCIVKILIIRLIELSDTRILN